MALELKRILKLVFLVDGMFNFHFGSHTGELIRAIW